MIRLLPSRFLIPVLLVVLALPACGDSADEAENTTLAPTTTAEAVTTTTAPTTTTTEAPEMMAEGSGIGDDLVEFSIVKTATAVTFTHNGTGAFKVQDLGADLEPAGLLIDTTGPYQGTRPLQWEAASGGFEITADGDWTYSVFNIDYARHEDCPIEGDGDDVVVVNDLKPAGGFETSGSHLVDVAFDGDTTFGIWIWGFGPTEHLVDTTGPFAETVTVPDGMAIWDITANGGAWTIECSSD